MGMDDRREHLHRRVWDLLPWYVNATLDPAERRTVEEHLAACTLCREEAARCREMGAAVKDTEEVAPSPHPTQLARLLARLDTAGEDTGHEAGTASSESAGRRSLARLAGLLAGTPRPMRLLLAGQAAALLLVAGALAWRGQPAAVGPALFSTLSEEPAAEGPAAEAAEGPVAPEPASQAQAARLRLLFAEGTAEREMRDLLGAVRGQIVGGPSPIGAYVVEIPAGAADDPLGLVLAHLRSRPQVTFAEPVAGEGAPAAETGGAGGSLGE